MLTRHIHPRELAVFDVEPAVAMLRSSTSGLNDNERINRRLRLGTNELPSAPPTPLVLRFLQQFASPFIFLLLAVAVISLMTGEVKDAVVIGTVLLLNATIGTAYSERASRSLRALQKRVVQKTSCLLSGVRVACDVRDIVPGDLVVLTAGDRIPADGRWIESTNLRVDESSLTGESVTVSKYHTPVALMPHAIAADIRNAGYAGTSCVSGTGTLLVTATGLQTEIGHIAAGLTKHRPEPPLITRVRALSHQVLIAVSIVASVLLVASFVTGSRIATSIAIILALVVSVVPQGLPIVLTVVLARGVHAMSKRNAIVKELAAVESLGGVDHIFTDKTGTLTLNRLRLVEAVLPDGSNAIFNRANESTDTQHPVLKGNEKAIHLMAEALAGVADPSAYTNELLPGVDPIDRAFTDLPRALGINAPVRHAERPFDVLRRTRAVTITNSSGHEQTILAGSPEAVIKACGLPAKAEENVLHRMASQGLRVIALASVQGPNLEQSDGSWTLLGLVGLRDESRPEAGPAITWCRDHNIHVTMITGDHPETAFAIAKQLGLAETRDQVALGDELMSLDGAHLTERMRHIRVVARAEPDTKLKLIQAARKGGKIIAMTGDGVNDAPALHAADVGVAMGIAGTDVAREAASVVLMDDNFATIVAAIQEGRSVVANVEKVVTYLLSTSAAETVIIGSALTFGLPTPLLPVQILWLNLVTDGFLDVALATEPTHGGHTKPPRGTLLTRRTWTRIALLGTTMGVVGSGVYLYTLLNSEEVFRFSATLLSLSVMQWWNAWSARSATRSALQMNPLGNRLLVAALVCVFLLNILAIYWPPISQLLRVGPLPLSVWLWVIPLGSTVLLADEVWKFTHRRHLSRTA